MRFAENDILFMKLHAGVPLYKKYICAMVHGKFGLFSKFVLGEPK
jgi:hypothetical protein